MSLGLNIIVAVEVIALLFRSHPMFDGHQYWSFGMEILPLALWLLYDLLIPCRSHSLEE